MRTAYSEHEWIFIFIDSLVHSDHWLNYIRDLSMSAIKFKVFKLKWVEMFYSELHLKKKLLINLSKKGPRDSS